MRNWIINTFFSDYRQRWLESATRNTSMDAFKKAHADIMETMADDLGKKADELAKVKLNALLSVIDPKSVVTFNKQTGIIYIGGERTDEGRLGNLKAEADFFANSDLWKIMVESQKSLAERAMFIAGENIEDVKKGRSILYTLSSQKNIVEIFRSYKIKPLAPQSESVV